MRHYEIVLLVHPRQSEQVPTMLARYKDMVSAEGGQVHRVEDWGRRRLAYMIKEVYKAHYVLLNIECSLKGLHELEKNFKFNDFILRSLIIRRKHAITEQTVIAKAEAEADRVEAEKKSKLQGKDTPEEVAEKEKNTPTPDAILEPTPPADSPAVTLESAEQTENSDGKIS